MSMQRIREVYGVPAKRGARVRYSFAGASAEGTITASTRGQLWLWVRLDGVKKTQTFHPTWNLEYLP